MKKSIFIFIISALAVSFNRPDNYRPTSFIIKGILVDYMTKKPVKNSTIYLSDKKASEFVENGDASYYKIQVKKRGEFLGTCFVDKNKRTFWLKVNNYAQINFVNCDSSWTYKDTLNLDTLVLLKYDCELDEKYSNVPEKSQKNSIYDKRDSYSINVLLNKIESDPNFKMTASKVDTVMSITRLNFGSDKPRGTIVQKFKTFYLTSDQKH